MKKIKVAFYLNNNGSVDCSNIVDANPGLGGSEYLLILVSTLLSERYDDLEVTLYSNYKGALPNTLKCVDCNSFQEFAEISQKETEKYCVVNYTSVDKSVIKQYRKLNFIIWCHNFVSWKDLDFYTKQSNVFRLIAVGREQLDLYRDHPAYGKSDYIYNAVPIDSLKLHYKTHIACKDRKNNVIYIGSLIQCKGFLYLAKAWKSVLKEFPDANLYVVGKGNLYDERAKLGKYGIAEEQFETSFIKYLSDENGLLDSVHFMGIMGSEKFDLIKQCKVGVPNPGGITETFGLTAVEMQVMGCRVTTIECPGYLDTIINKNMLYKHTSQLSDYIVKGLSDTSEDKMEYIWKTFSDKFSYNAVLPLWHKLFTMHSDMEDVYLHTDRDKLYNEHYHLKKIKTLIARIKHHYVFLKGFPALERILYKQH